MTAPDPAAPTPSGSAAGPASVEALTRQLDSITPWVRWWLRAEGFAGFTLGVLVWCALGGDWIWLLPALFLPDIAMAGYLGGPHMGAIAYNLAHNWFIGGLVLLIGLWAPVTPLAFAGAILVAHTGMDRVMGYGLKYPTGFGDTHLGAIGRRR